VPPAKPALLLLVWIILAHVDRLHSVPTTLPGLVHSEGVI